MQITSVSIMRTAPAFISSTAASSFLKISTLFSATLATASLFKTAAVSAISAHIIPIAIGAIAVSVALVFLWKRIYGSNPQPAKKPSNPAGATPPPAPGAPNGARRSSFSTVTPFTSVRPSSVRGSSQPVVIVPATSPVPGPARTEDATPAPAVAAAPAIDLTPAAPPSSPRPSGAAPQPTVSTRDTIRSTLNRLNIPQLDKRGDNQFETRARKEKLVEADGVAYCVFAEDHEGYKANERYPIVGWGKGNKNDYFYLNKLEGATTIQSPREAGEDDTYQDAHSPTVRIRSASISAGKGSRRSSSRSLATGN